MNLFQLGKFKLNSGEISDYKIECDALENSDWECLAHLISQRVDFSEVIGVPTGGNILAEHLKQYCKEGYPRLVVDDVLTTGGSMRKIMQDTDIGFVVFARGDLPSNIACLFRMY